MKDAFGGGDGSIRWVDRGMRLINEINGIRAHLAMQRGVDTGVGVGGEDLVGTSSTATATRFHHSPRVSLECGYSGTWYRLVHHIYIKVHHWYVDTFPNHLATYGTPGRPHT